MTRSAAACAMTMSALTAFGCQTGSPVVSAPLATPADNAELVASDAGAPPVARRELLFQAEQVWTGEYECPQGTTSLRLRIRTVHDDVVNAIFEFHHAPSGSFGQYEIGGRLDPRSRHVLLSPRTWIVHPHDYIMVGMDGTVSSLGDTFSGRITQEGCGAFSVRRN